MAELVSEPTPQDPVSWLPILGDFFIHHFFPSLLYYNDYSDLYACRQVNKWFRAHLNPPRVRLKPSKFRGFDRMRTIAPVVEKLICLNFSDVPNISRLIESPFFSKATALRTLQFTSCPNLKTGAVAMLCNNLSRLKSLTSLDMAGADVFEASRQQIVAAVGAHPSISRLKLPKLHWSEGKKEDTDALGEHLTQCTRIDRLRISIRAFGWTGNVRPVLHALEKLYQLRCFELELADVGWNNHHQSTEHFLDAIYTFLMNAKKLSKFHFDHSSITKYSMDELFHGLKENTTITDLRLSSLSPQPAALADALRSNPRLTRLSLRGCKFGHDNLQQISDAILDIKTLVRLDLSHAAERFSKADVLAFSDSLLKNSTLQTLVVVSSIVTQPLAMAPLARALGEHPSLTKVDLAGNGSDEATMTEFGRALRKNTTLRSLNLARGGHSHLAPLFEGLEFNQGLRRLDLGSSYMNPKDYKALVQAVKGNRNLVSLSLRSTTFSPSLPFGDLFAARTANTVLSSVDLRDIK
eukprot:TRINITY_DN6843_c0_g1_i1.p1 TRINITY_DN6843_c0_g1~~TRINITY_DN6843_c0_g1_i1.p1  ORF type:complete len:523 (+),score=30.36 TRINITY_DN6843_c0_g1_i1:184-1752(+)